MWARDGNHKFNAELRLAARTDRFSRDVSDFFSYKTPAEALSLCHIHSHELHLLVGV